jgi:ribosomal protein S18 acetylase RimI-like enzyme
MPERFAVFQAVTADAELVEAFARLIPQLAPSGKPPSLAAVAEIIAAPGTALLLAREILPDPATGDASPGSALHSPHAPGRIVGTLTLVTYRIPVGLKAWIEDVVVDSAWRRRGVGEALTREALRLARERGAATVDLTSRPSRAEAHALYGKLGFAERETRVYRHRDVTEE